MSQDPQTKPADLLLLCRDLMFVSKVTSAARAANVALRVIREPKDLDLEDRSARRLFADLSQEGTLEAAAAWKKATGGRIIGFAPHTAGTSINAAREAGFDAILARSSFTAKLDELIRG